MTDATDATNAPTRSAATTGCVQCHEPLVLRTHETAQVLACERGHGVFLHAESLRAAVRDRTDDRPVEEEQAAVEAEGSASLEALEAAEAIRTCPTCGTPMHKQVFAYESGVTTDVCDEHGVWLDEGELHRVEAWYEAHERHLEQDRATWGGQHGKLEAIEQAYEEEAARDTASMHWGPVAWFHQRASYWWARRDDR